MLLFSASLVQQVYQLLLLLIKNVFSLSLWSEGGIKTRSGASVQLNKTAALLSLNESSGRTRLSHIYFDQLRFSTKTLSDDTFTLNSTLVFLCLDVSGSLVS